MILKIFLLIFLFVLVSLPIFWLTFSFDFKGEDWYQLWIISQPEFKDLVFKTLLFKHYPISTFQELFLFNFFGFNPFSWIAFGYVIKIVNALAVALMVYGITKSKKAAVFSGLVFAALVAGLNAYIRPSLQTSALIITPLCVGVYYWVESAGKKLVNRQLLLAAAFFLFAVLGNPARGMVVFILAFLWDLLKLFPRFSREKLSEFIFRSLLLIILISLVFFIMQLRGEIGDRQALATQKDITYIITHIRQVSQSFLGSMNNLFFGWFIGDLGISLVLMPTLKLIGQLLIIICLYLLIKFTYLKGKQELKVPIFFILWMPICFFPSWMLTQSFNLVAAVTHHYLALSAIGVAGFIGYYLSKINSKYVAAIFLLILIPNIMTANGILQRELRYRSADIHNRIWSQIDREVPKEQKNGIFWFKGDVYLVEELTGTDAIPFALRRGLVKPEDIPVTRVDEDLVKKLICNKGTPRPTAIWGTYIQEMPLPISSLYVWEIHDGIMQNVSVRERLTMQEQCRQI